MTLPNGPRLGLIRIWKLAYRHIKWGLILKLLIFDYLNSYSKAFRFQVHSSCIQSSTKPWNSLKQLETPKTTVMVSDYPSPKNAGCKEIMQKENIIGTP